jgi:alkanesulfonate monooxygenase SsuD/methylene tetrahydromethanopterin reductase-like flavin-dependent oxidoreductase (luciferase family)
MGVRARYVGRGLSRTQRDNVAVRFGVFLPPFAEFAEPRRVVALAQQAETAGWDGLFLWDHMLAFPGMPVADPWVVMAAVATITQRIRLGALVTPLPRRRPWVLSRQMATLDQLSEGRLIGGIGLGDDGWSEFSSFGDAVDPVTRGAMLDEALELLQRFLNGEPVSYDGLYYTVHSPALLPTPLQRPLPLWGAVRWPNRKPLARIARLQGCFPIFHRPGGLPPPDPADIRGLRSALLDRGASTDIDIAVRCELSTEEPASVAETVAALEASGVTWMLEAVAPGTDPDVVSRIVQQGPPSAV